LELLSAAPSDPSTLNGGLGADRLRFAGLFGVNVLDLANQANNTGRFANATFSNFETFEMAAGTPAVSQLDFRGNSAANTVLGGSDADLLKGNGGDDALNGRLGNDTLAGGLGLDELRGGGGRDIFDYDQKTHSPAGLRRDVILDFQEGTNTTFFDRVDVKGIDANELASAPGNQAFAFIGTAAFAPNDPGAIRYAKSGGDTFIFLNTDNDVAAEAQIQLAGLHTLGANDFLL
jgi:Ca2+-binding RTX toxin-like protein